MSGKLFERILSSRIVWHLCEVDPIFGRLMRFPRVAFEDQCHIVPEGRNRRGGSKLWRRGFGGVIGHRQRIYRPYQGGTTLLRRARVPEAASCRLFRRAYRHVREPRGPLEMATYDVRCSAGVCSLLWNMGNDWVLRCRLLPGSDP